MSAPPTMKIKSRADVVAESEAAESKDEGYSPEVKPREKNVTWNVQKNKWRVDISKYGGHTRSIKEWNDKNDPSPAINYKREWVRNNVGPQTKKKKECDMSGVI